MANKNLEDLASIGQIAAGIAHEVRNPLTTVKGFLQLLQQEHPHPYLKIASNELEQAIETLQSLLHISRSDTNDEPFTSIDLCSELESILYLFKKQAYQVKIIKKFQDTHERIYGKKNSLKKALFNLIKNAFEAIAESNAENGTITIEHYRDGSSVIVVIRDNGIGIPEDKLHLLGTPFFSTKDDGTGMGLTQVYASVSEHGGNIHVSSQPHEGTTFRLEFPLSKEKGLNKSMNIISDTLSFQDGQPFKDFFLANQQIFLDMLNNQTESMLSHFEQKLTRETLLETAIQLGELLEEGKQHELIMLAKTRGVDWAKHDIPLILILEWTQSYRKAYWDFLESYHQRVEIDKNSFFQLQHLTNSMLDNFTIHLCTSYTEYKDELIRSHREMIEDLTVPIIPISTSVAVLPIIGTVDTYRAKKIRERTLKQITLMRIKKIIIDLSGVAYMDTAVISHLFRMVDGINLLGCAAVVTGIRPEVAETIVDLDISMNEKVETKGTLQQALEEYGSS